MIILCQIRHNIFILVPYDTVHVVTTETVRARGMMYNPVDQSVLLLGSEIWVVTGEMQKVLEGFHHRVARHIVGMMSTRGAARDWEYPPVVTSMESSGLHPIREYIRRRQATIAEKLPCRPHTGSI